jgi:hypothetical protein
LLPLACLQELEQGGFRVDAMTQLPLGIDILRALQPIMDTIAGLRTS